MQYLLLATCRSGRCWILQATPVNRPMFKSARQCIRDPDQGQYTHKMIDITEDQAVSSSSGLIAKNRTLRHECMRSCLHYRNFLLENS